MRGIVAPFVVGAKIGDRRLDLDDQQRAVAVDADDVGAPPAGERQLGDGGETARPEQPPDAAANRRAPPRTGGRRPALRAAERPCQRPAASARIIAAAFSAIIIVGAAGVARGDARHRPKRRRCGSRRRRAACSEASTTAVGSSSRPIFAVPTGWKIVVPMSPAALTSSASLCSRRARQIFRRAEAAPAPAPRRCGGRAGSNRPRRARPPRSRDSSAGSPARRADRG